MRIISGKYRGLKLNEFEGSAIRPTADRVKESLFNIIFSRVADARVLDLFCGSGRFLPAAAFLFTPSEGNII